MGSAGRTTIPSWIGGKTKTTVPSWVGLHHNDPRRSKSSTIADEHAHHLPGFVPKDMYPSAKTKPPSVSKASVAPKSFEDVAALRKQYEAGARKDLTAKLGKRFTEIPKWAQQQFVDQWIKQHTVPKDNRPDLEKAVDTQVTEPLLSKAPKLASSKLTTPLTVAGQAAAEVSGVPSAIRLAGDVKHHKVAAGAVEAASLFPLGRFGKLAKAVREGSEEVRAGNGLLFHGSPEGELGTIDPFYHTKPWREGPGFYVTTSPAKAAKYAAGKTASAERKTGKGLINVVKLKPGTKVLHMDAAPESFWRDIASYIIGEKVTPERWQEWARDIKPQKGMSPGILNRMRLLHILTGYDDMPKSDAYYAIEDALYDKGYQATLHHENGVPVYIVKDAEAIERHGTMPPPRVESPPPAPPALATPLLPAAPVGKALKGAKEAEVAAKSAHTTEEAAKVREAIPGMKVARGKQAAGYKAERAKRFAAAEAHLSNPNLSSDEAQALARHELRGELPKIEYKGFEHVTPEALSVMRNDIRNHPLLSTADKIKTDEALMKAMAGKVPQPKEIYHLEQVFGKPTTNGLIQIAKHPARQTILSALNIPRSIMASMDLSAPFRQGLVVATRHPVIFAKNFVPMVKAFGSEKVYHAILDDIRSRPTYPMMLEAKLNMTELGKTAGLREEQFGSDLAETLTGGKRSPIRASGRAYTAFLDKTRADVFDHLIARAQTQTKIDRILGPLGRKQVEDIHNEKFLKDLGRYINSATGRGPLGTHLQGAATALNAVFFSPRLLASRLDLIFSPITYAKADPFVRREALRSMFMLAGTASTLLYLASRIPGAKVVTDPRNPDWGKIKVGNTRIDIGGGFQQPLRLFAQVATGVAISSTTGKKLNLTANGFGQPTRLDLALRFFEGKESPIASFATDWLRNSDQVGNKFEVGREVRDRLIPLLWQDTADLYHEQHGGVNGITAAFAGNALGTFGFGLQTYGPKKPKTRGSSKTPSYFGGGSSGGSDYFSGGSAGGSAYFGG